MSFEVVNDQECYCVKPLTKRIDRVVVVPGSKSMTNRALLLAALSQEKSLLRGVLFSDDSRHFLDCLTELGFSLDINEEAKEVSLQGCGGSIPKKTATINVGSAGTAARFLTSMLALSDGTYTIQCSEQMERRPMEELLNVLTEMGASFTFLKQEGHLPVKVIGNGGKCKDISMDISASTQFLSAMLMVTPVTKSGIKIHITSKKKTGAYINITTDMLQKFGVNVDFDGENYTVAGGQKVTVGDYYIEPDVSAACYFYGLAALTGSKITVKNVFYSSVQGDIKFIELLKHMGCKVGETMEGIYVEGPLDGILQGIRVDMNNFSDQALTLAAIAPFAKGETVIQNVGHIRGQECDRIAAIVQNLTACGIECHVEGDDIHILPGTVHAAEIETFDDHRVAMAFSLMGLKTPNIVIKNPMCCRKTFENYFECLDGLYS